MSACDLRESFLDRALAPPEQATFAAHLETCLSCQREVASWQLLEREVTQAAQVGEVPAPSLFKAQRLIRSAEERLEAPRRSGWRRPALALLAASLALGVWVFSRSAPPPAAPAVARAPLVVSDPSGQTREIPPSQVIDTWVPAPADAPLRLGLGQDHLVLAKQSRVRVRRADSTETRVELGAGRLSVRVEPRAAGQRFVVESGEVRVEVTGTRFRVERTSAAVAVAVSEGRVKVSWPGGDLTELLPGQRLAVEGVVASRGALTDAELAAVEEELVWPPAQPKAAIAPPQAEPLEEEPAPVEPATASARSTAPLALWRSWVVQGDYDKAEQALSAHLRRHPRDAAALSLLADERRKAGHWQAAVDTYERLIAVGDPQAANRARLLAASVLQDELGEHTRAAQLLQAYLRAGSRVQPLEAAAMARLARSLRATGRTREAKALLQSILEKHPDSPAANEARQLLEEP